ncbi:hypothetical protein M378DRAFT_180398 [Amanita muscaria Koide BX008]|uniref:HotDog ACOT-type domain-containing protein n=1 Tax=Amanita muscaria (strain Koide BX008) TaxID=946122 RepID=A0A0C2WGP7_AMAMK|nr:hypothetical protein M378DRAFT_180398 [Amanita muscaria Koide BX008]
MFTRGSAQFISLEGISFSRPVPIGSILRLTSYILHTTSSDDFSSVVHVGVKANVADVQTGSEHTFGSRGTRNMGLERRYLSRKRTKKRLEGKRASKLGAEVRGERPSELEVACSTSLHRFPFRQVFGCNIVKPIATFY